MAAIVVSRSTAPWPDRLRSYKIVIDGEQLATLRRGEEATLAVEAGHHKVRARIDWCRSRDIDLELRQRDRAYLLCQPGFAFSLIRPRMLLYATIWRKRYLDLQLLRIEVSG